MFDHFVIAQNKTYPAVLSELRAGAKQSHWMWFVFPQLRALGRSPTAQQFGLADLEEAQAYASHPVLGPRLKECVALANAVEGRTAAQIFGSIDALKYRSCLTLFWRATGGEIFLDGLTKHYSGEEDPLTLAELR
jgi:uncharacterized protein (DUF1810 family)